MADSVTLCVDVVNNTCKVAQVENFYFLFFNYFILSTSIESKRCMCLFCGYVGKVTDTIQIVFGKDSWQIQIVF